GPHPEATSPPGYKYRAFGLARPCRFRPEVSDGMAGSETVRILAATEIEALLAELQALLSTLPPSLPDVPACESKYGALLGFIPDPELVEDVGEVGAVNTALERMFGHRQDGLKILERGEPIRAIVPVLEKFLKQHSGDIILQKWLTDFVAAAREMRPKRTIRQTERAREGDLKRKCPDTSDTSMLSIEPNDDDDLLTDDFAPESSESSDNIDSPRPEPPMESHEPRQKSRSASKKRLAKKAKKTGPPHDAIPEASDKRYVDVTPALPANTSRSGAPRNELAD
ncbi:hypothetical protein FRC08_013211, partial [Ceratobasidium sp. 394]